MTKRIPPIERAIVVLDQLTGALRLQDDARVLGLDIWQDLGSLGAGIRPLDFILAVPSEAAHLANGGESFAAGLKIVALTPGGELPAQLSAKHTSAQPTALVTADRKLRGDAMSAGLYPAPHPALLTIMSEGTLPEAARVAGHHGQLVRWAAAPGLVPMHFQPIPGSSDQWALIALAPPRLLAKAAVEGLSVSPLACDPMTDDLIWIRVEDNNRHEVLKHLGDRQILYSEPGQILLALAPGDDAEAVDAHGSHGHRELLVPSPEILAAPVLRAQDQPGLAPWPLRPEIIEVVRRPVLRPVLPTCSTVTANYEEDLNRYTGVTALDSAGPVLSRHINHTGNARTETQLLKDLKVIGYCPTRHNFVHAGKTYSNIIADLPGTGTHRIRPEILQRYKEIVPLPNRPALEDLAQALGAPSDELAPLPDNEIKEQVERALGLAPWFPWWRNCTLPGLGSELVIVGCHLDSTAASQPGYQSASHPAPGRDDDGSGLAAVLALARHLRSLSGKLKHTVRFCFFNAEEAGLVGSKAYAANLKAMNAPVRGAICMDMIGYNSDVNRLFEIHAGYTDPVVRDRSLPLVPLVANAASAYGVLAAAQVYQGTSSSSGSNRNLYDGAINRSDHAAFHQQGYAAILVSEDFFVNLASEPAADPNPNYHRGSDTLIDLNYARAIVCAVSRAVVNLAH